LRIWLARKATVTTISSKPWLLQQPDDVLHHRPVGQRQHRLGALEVSGRRRVPSPPAMITAFTHLTTVAHEIGRAQQRAFGCERVGLIIAGYEVPHVHLHVIPTDSMDQLAFANAARSVSPEELNDAASRIRAELRAAGRPEVSD
jgi:hypothetical protein